MTRLESPIIDRLLRDVAHARDIVARATGFTDMPVEIWVNPEQWCDLAKTAPPEWLMICNNGEPHKAEIFGAEIWFSASVPVTGPWQIRIRMEKTL